MRPSRILIPLACAVALSSVAGAARAQPRPAPSGPPHAWLFGAWTGGLFPVLDGQLEQDCRTGRTVVFAQDVVGHASLTGSDMAQSVIETVRTTPTGAEFRFTPQPGDPKPGDTGFGCTDPNELPVLRESPTTISFPRCAAFPYRLERCTTR